mgnify:CR=1 FL=1
MLMMKAAAVKTGQLSCFPDSCSYDYNDCIFTTFAGETT